MNEPAVGRTLHNGLLLLQPYTLEILYEISIIDHQGKEIFFNGKG